MELAEEGDPPAIEEPQADPLDTWDPEAEEPGEEEEETVPPIIIEPSEQVGGRPQLATWPDVGMSPAVAKACTHATFVSMGLAAPIAGGHPLPTGTVPPAPAPSTGMGRSPGMSLAQWEALQASSGGGPTKPTGLGRRPSQRRATSTVSSATPPTPTPPTGAGGVAQGAASSSQASLSSRAKKKARGFIPWNPTAAQLSHAQLLLRGSGKYYMDPPLCLSLNDPRMGGLPPSKKWRCAYCALHFFSQLDCQGHALATHSKIRSPPICPCGRTFNSAKLLRDHLQLQHNINATAVKTKEPPVPLLLDDTRPMRPPPTGGN